MSSFLCLSRGRECPLSSKQGAGLGRVFSPAKRKLMREDRTSDLTPQVWISKPPTPPQIPNAFINKKTGSESGQNKGHSCYKKRLSWTWVTVGHSFLFTITSLLIGIQKASKATELRFLSFKSRWRFGRLTQKLLRLSCGQSGIETSAFLGVKHPNHYSIRSPQPL